MKIYFAPLESISSYPLRNTHSRFFPGIDKYFTPFISANEEGHYSGRIARDLDPENNTQLSLVPQIMGKNPEAVKEVLHYLAERGYHEINLNMGCPSGTVVAKGKGAGMLRDLYLLEDFLTSLFSVLPKEMSLSIKCRIGIADCDGMEALFSLFNAFPLSELIVHPRVQKQFYNGTVRLDQFAEITKLSKHKLIYNGDIENARSAMYILSRFPSIKGIMLGRGILTNPALAREIRGGAVLEEEEFKRYIISLEEAFSAEIQEERNLLQKLKECWSYFSKNYPYSNKGLKELRKARTMPEYRSAKYRIYSECAFIAYGGKDLSMQEKAENT